jgi:hypothetical protein
MNEQFIVELEAQRDKSWMWQTPELMRAEKDFNVTSLFCVNI